MQPLLRKKSTYPTVHCLRAAETLLETCEGRACSPPVKAARRVRHQLAIIREHIEVVGSLIKRWLWRLRNATASNRDREGPDQLPLRRQRFLLAVFILLGLTSMVLLLLWNYKCIFIDRLCEGQEGSSVFPVFGGKVPAPTKDGQA
ncbi:hypothetical protein AGOR_G00051050 [Albula goreensis]|uniref:Uncharacterized protein n=1 Tax=Albula goreensis TaxID=1534307 RepID=A0A8T3DYU2_9TELE|nr:hypothetical protein AGOR_G00051050 [Albula goreensis]